MKNRKIFKRGILVVLVVIYNLCSSYAQDVTSMCKNVDVLEMPFYIEDIDLKDLDIDFHHLGLRSSLGEYEIVVYKNDEKVFSSFVESQLHDFDVDFKIRIDKANLVDKNKFKIRIELIYEERNEKHCFEAVVPYQFKQICFYHTYLDPSKSSESFVTKSYDVIRGKRHSNYVWVSYID